MTVIILALLAMLITGGLQWRSALDRHILSRVRCRPLEPQEIETGIIEGEQTYIRALFAELDELIRASGVPVAVGSNAAHNVCVASIAQPDGTLLHLVNPKQVRETSLTAEYTERSPFCPESEYRVTRTHGVHIQHGRQRDTLKLRGPAAAAAQQALEILDGVSRCT